MEKKNPQITIKNIKSFLEGNSKMFLSKLGFQAEHLKEQIAYRMLICNDVCGKQGYCEKCGCDYPGKLYVNESCNNGEKFPDLMSKQDWIKFKQENGIDDKKL